MARIFNGSSQYLSASSTLLSDEPIDMVCYFNADINTTFLGITSLGDTGAATGIYCLECRGDVGGDPIDAFKREDGGAASGSAQTSSGFSTAAWTVGAVTFISNTSRASFINGGSKGTNTTSVTDPTPNVVSVGALVRSTVSGYFDGTLAEAYILDANMTDAQHALAGKGISPFWLIPGKNVRAWYPLQGHNNNRVRNGYPDLTATGSPTNGTHPARVHRPRINGVMAV